MDQKAFELIAEKVGEALREQEFTRLENGTEDKGPAAYYANENLRYSVLFDTQKKRFFLCGCMTPRKTTWRRRRTLRLISQIPFRAQNVWPRYRLPRNAAARTRKITRTQCSFLIGW